MPNVKQKVAKTSRVTVRMPPDLWKRMDALERRTGATPSAQVRLAVEHWLKQQEAGR